jgi:hypothetical protein
MDALIQRLRESPPNVLLQREAADAIERLQRQLALAAGNAARASRCPHGVSELNRCTRCD